MYVVFVINPFVPTDLYGMFQIKAWTIPLWILGVERVNENTKFNNCQILYMLLSSRQN